MALKGYLKQAGRLKDIVNIIRECKIRHLLHYDISEPKEMINNVPRLHLHGVIVFTENSQIREWLLTCLPQISYIGLHQRMYLMIQPIYASMLEKLD